MRLKLNPSYIGVFLFELPKTKLWNWSATQVLSGCKGHVNSLELQKIISKTLNQSMATMWKIPRRYSFQARLKALRVHAECAFLRWVGCRTAELTAYSWGFTATSCPPCTWSWRTSESRLTLPFIGRSWDKRVPVPTDVADAHTGTLIPSVLT